MLHGLSIKKDLSFTELKLRLYILQNLANNIDDLAANDPVNTMMNINIMTLYDAYSL